MRKNDKFVHVQVSMLHESGAGVLAVPVSRMEALQDAGVIFHDERWNPPFVMSSEFDDIALAIPGSFIVRG